MNTNTIQNPVPILQQPKSNIVTNPLITGTQTKITDACGNQKGNEYNNSISAIKIERDSFLKTIFVLLGVTLLILGIISSFVFN